MLDNHFNYNSSLVANDGKIYLGSLSGMIRFAPEKLNKNVKLPPLVATQLSIGNEAVYGAQNEAYMSRSAEKWVRGLCFNELGVGG